MKYFLIFVVVLALAFFFLSISALALYFCASELHGPLGTPDLTWWQSFVVLWAVALIGAAFNGSAIARFSSEK